MTAKSRARKNLKRINKEKTDDRSQPRNRSGNAQAVRTREECLEAHPAGKGLVPRNLGDHGPFTPESQAEEDAAQQVVRNYLDWAYLKLAEVLVLYGEDAARGFANGTWEPPVESDQERYVREVLYGEGRNHR